MNLQRLLIGVKKSDCCATLKLHLIDILFIIYQTKDNGMVMYLNTKDSHFHFKLFYVPLVVCWILCEPALDLII